ncbi:hypothetical protein OC846_006853 [Tilletia horrida]|uniref:Uncharacterized protein n=1 Tax=Tilletia horrida TaxID=155126 RepID=A0AAN6GKU7_9BASI|nr:hypothetical protein OC846_006853 [Tilletia horrida]KAK0558211.1 hypothetical protein OC861_006958 [Tilletia horrida]
MDSPASPSTGASAPDTSASTTDSTLFTVWALTGVRSPAAVPGNLGFRESEVAQEIERVLIAMMSFSALNSAVGAVEEVSAKFRRYIEDHVQDRVNRTTDVSLQTRIQDYMRGFIQQLSRRPPATTGRLIEGTPFESVIRYASSAPTNPSSAVITKDISEESHRPAADDRVSFFGTAAGPGPALEARLSGAVERLWSGQPELPPPRPFQLRFYWDFWWAVLVSKKAPGSQCQLILTESGLQVHALVALHARYLRDMIQIANVKVLMVESSKVSSLFVSGTILEPEGIDELDRDELPLHQWVDHVCTIYIHGDTA